MPVYLALEYKDTSPQWAAGCGDGCMDQAHPAAGVEGKAQGFLEPLLRSGGRGPQQLLNGQTSECRS